jgi:polysaccharide export outer membrane protein
VTRRPHLLLVAAILAFPGIHSIEPVAAQTTAPSAEQLEILRSLPAEQREAILRQMTEGGSGGSVGTSRDGNRADRESQRNAASDQEAVRRPSDEEDAREPQSPVLKGDDTVIINIDLRKSQPGLDALAPAAMPALPGQAILPGQANPQGAAAPPPTSQAQRVVELTQEERERRNRLVDLVRSRNPYRLSSEGVLSLPGFGPIPLAGLTEFQATVRLQAQHELRDFDVALVLLPLKKIGAEALKPFGYDLFDRSPSTFAPVTNIPVPADYVVGAGDELSVQLYGSQNRNFTLVVGRDGRVSFPELGPISVGHDRCARERFDGRHPVDPCVRAG